jgi:D-3-phosphoglycerate dehydrogenase
MNTNEKSQYRWHVVVTGPEIAQEAHRLLSKSCSVGYTEPYTEPAKLAEKVGSEKADALIVRMGTVTEAVIQASSGLKVISKHGTGVDNIDIAAASKRKIPVLKAADSNYESVAEHALGLMLALAKDINTMDAKVRRGRWDKAGYKGAELFGKTLGIVGCGRIGRRLSEIVAPLKMKVLAYDPYVGSEMMPPGVTKTDKLEDLLASADMVTVHCPLTEESRHMIGEREFEAMKPTAWLINTARGGIVDEKALTRALDKGEIAAAGVDVFEKEPIENIEPLTDAGKTVLTPHIAGVTGESYVRMGVGAAQNALTVLEGRDVDPACLMNPEIFDS